MGNPTAAGSGGGGGANGEFIDEQRSRQHVRVQEKRREGGREGGRKGGSMSAWWSTILILLPLSHAQQLMLREQDQGLEELGTAVDRVGRMADAMNQELNAQNRMLGDLEVEVENTNEQMNFVMGKLSKLLKTKGKFELSWQEGAEEDGGGCICFGLLSSLLSLVAHLFCPS